MWHKAARCFLLDTGQPAMGPGLGSVRVNVGVLCK